MNFTLVLNYCRVTCCMNHGMLHVEYNHTIQMGKVSGLIFLHYIQPMILSEVTYNTMSAISLHKSKSYQEYKRNF